MKGIFPWAVWMLAMVTACTPAHDPPPNILVILADDMGYSDLGCYGSGIHTPTLDRLAAEGLRMTQFYNAGRCCPSRASLLMGRSPHAAGIGSMTDYTLPDHPAYQGYLRQDAPTIAEMLRSVGYHTYHSGKWHVGGEPGQLPLDRGFDRSFTFVGGAGSYFDFLPYRNQEWPFGPTEIRILDDGQAVAQPDTQAYLTDVFTDHAAGYLREAAQAEAPFFLYLAYTAPHWPLHALPEDIARYEAAFLGGWDSVRAVRFARQQGLGLVDPQGILSPREASIPAWDSLLPSEQQVLARKMAVYAAMVDRMDQQIGRLLDVLDQTGQADETLVLFLSDNGGAKAGHVPYLHPRFSDSAPIGSAQSFTAYSRGWANTSDAPFRRYKAELYEGGIATPMIAWWPAQIAPGRIERQAYAAIADIWPTAAEIAGAETPAGLSGKSLLPLFQGASFPNQPLFWEHFGRRAVRQGAWKLVSGANAPWELYHLAVDPTELHNVAASYPDTAAALAAKYQQWADSLDVLPLDSLQARYQARR